MTPASRATGVQIVFLLSPANCAGRRAQMVHERCPERGRARQHDGERVAPSDIGQPVLFPLYTSTVRGDDKPGEVLHLSPDSLLQLPPLHTVLRGGKRAQ